MKKLSLILVLLAFAGAFADGKKSITKEEREKRKSEQVAYSRGCNAVCESGQLELYRNGKKLDGADAAMCYATKETSKKIKRVYGACGK